MIGNKELVEEQEADSPARQLSDDGERSVSEHVSTVVRNNGLSDSSPEPDNDTRE